MDQIRTSSEASKSFNLAGLLAGLNGPLGSANKLFASLLGQDDAEQILAKPQDKVSGNRGTKTADDDKSTIWSMFPKQTLPLLKQVVEKLHAYEKTRAKDNKDTPVDFAEHVAKKQDDADAIPVVAAGPMHADPKTPVDIESYDKTCGVKFAEPTYPAAVPSANDNASDETDETETDPAAAALLALLNQVAQQTATTPADTDDVTVIDATSTSAVAAPSNDNQGDEGDKVLAGLIDNLEELTDLIEKRLQVILNIKDMPAPVKANAAPVVTPAATLAPQVAAAQSAIVASSETEVPVAETAPVELPPAETAASDTEVTPEKGVVGVLTQLLQVVHSIEHRLADKANIAPADAAVDETAPQPVASENLPLDQQLKIDVTALRDAIKAQIEAAKKAAATPAPVTVAADMADVDSAIPTPVSDAPKALPAGPEATKRNEITQDDFLNLFTSNRNDAPAHNTSYAPATGEAAVATGGKGASTDFEFDTKTGGNSARYTPSSLENTNLAGASSGATSPYSFASQLSATRALNGGTTGLPSALEQVKLQLHRAAKGGQDQMSIQLRPAELGRIDIKLNFSADGKVQGTVVAESQATLDLLLKDVRGLERALQEAGLRADPGSLQFSLGGQAGNSSGRMPGDTSQTNKQNQAGDQTEEADTATAEAGEIWYVTPGRVNLKV